jgi:hypothetical protein
MHGAIAYMTIIASDSTPCCVCHLLNDKNSRVVNSKNHPIRSYQATNLWSSIVLKMNASKRTFDSSADFVHSIADHRVERQGKSDHFSRSKKFLKKT